MSFDVTVAIEVMSQFQVPVGERCARMLEEKEIVSSSDLFDCKIPTVAREEITFFCGASRDSSIGGEFKFGDETKCANAIFSLFNLCYLRTNLCVKSRPQVAK